MLGYLVYIIAFYFFQEKLMFHPSSTYRMPPKSFNIEQKFIQKENGDSLMTWWQKNNEKGKTFIFFSGNAGNISGRIFFVEMAKSLEMNILLFDYTGFGLSSGKPKCKEDFFDDSKTVIEYLINQKNIRSENIILWGLSLGGPLVANLAEKYAVGGVIFEGVMTSIKDVVKDLNFFRYNILPLDLLFKYNFNTGESIKNIDEPVLFLHSKEDSLVRYNHAETLFSLAKNSNKQLIPLKGSHQRAHYDSYDIYVKGVRDFLETID